MTHERRIFLLAFAAGLPGSLLALGILWSGDYTPKVQWTFTVFVLCLWFGFAYAAHERTLLPLQTVANLLEALREGDYSIRAREPHVGDSLGDVMIEVNKLSAMLRRTRFDEVDASKLLQKVIAEIDVAIFNFDDRQILRLVNRAGERIFAQPAARLLGRGAADLSLADCLQGEAARTFERSFPGQSGRWQARRSHFREAGRPHQLLVLTDLSKALRDEERQAWQRLIRVLGHELNNSLAPIKSTASTLASLLRRGTPSETWQEDAQRGLAIIADRSESLNRFVAAYSRLARLPPPRLQSVAIEVLVRRVVAFERRMAVALDPDPLHPDLAVQADSDQLEQLLINLLKNAVEAVLETEHTETKIAENGNSEIEDIVTVGWRAQPHHLEISVADTGPGLANTNNLFVPFFTTKPGGTGIGLVLCRQIAEAHGGSLTLENRSSGSGCIARLRLPR